MATVEFVDALVNATKDQLRAEIENDYLSCGDSNVFFFLIVGALVFLMQMGFAMLEYSAVHPHHGGTVLLKNLMDVVIAGLTWWLVGNKFVNGETYHKLIGKVDKVDLDVTGEYGSWFFAFAFAATAATIVSGAIAERTRFFAYFFYSVVLTAIVYPVVAHWVWAGGWLNAEQVIDFAGSGVVHMVGGVAALWGAVFVGPRKFMETKDGFKPRFENGAVNDHKYIQNHLPFGVLGTLVLWFGWYGFNPGSVLGVCGVTDLMGTAIVTTTICPAAAAITGCLWQMITNAIKGTNDSPDPAFICNCILGGLVAITAAAGSVENWAALVIGVIATFVYTGTSKLLKILKIDDVIDAFPVHGACGAWGLIATGLFSSKRLTKVFARDYYGTAEEELDDFGAGLFYDGSKLIGWQLIFVVAVFAWVTLFMVPLFGALRVTGMLRLDETSEKYGHSIPHAASSDDDLEMASTSKEAEANAPTSEGSSFFPYVKSDIPAAAPLSE